MYGTIQVIRMYQLDIPEDVIAGQADPGDAAERWLCDLTTGQIEEMGDLLTTDTDYPEVEQDCEVYDPSSDRWFDGAYVD